MSQLLNKLYFEQSLMSVAQLVKVQCVI